MEILKKIIETIAPYFAGITIGGLFTAIIYGVLKGAFAKTINKINVDKIASDATEKGLKKIKAVTMKHNIQPILESGLEKVNEKSNEYIDNALSKIYTKLDKIIAIQEKQAEYFDASIGVTDEKKEELHKAIADAKEEQQEEITIVNDNEEIVTQRVEKQVFGSNVER